MIFLITGLTILVFALGWVLIAPFRLTIDTKINHYCLWWKHIVKIEVLPLQKDLRFRLKIWFWTMDQSLLEWRPKIQSGKTFKKGGVKSNRLSKFWRNKFWTKGRKILRSFEVKAFRLNLDTNNFVTNSYLYPLFYVLNHPLRQLNINYNGDSELLLIVENRLYKILFAFLF